MSGLPVAEITAITHCAEIPVLDEGEEAWELAFDAATAVVERNSVPLDEVGQVIYAGSGEWDLPLWSPAAKVADELGIARAHCFEIVNFCNASTAAIRTGMDAVLTGWADYVLLLLGDRMSRFIDYTDPDSKSLFNFGDTATAMLLGRTGEDFRLLHTATRTDPSWCEFYSGEREEHRAVVRRRGRRPGAADAYVENLSALVGETLSALGKSADDVAHLLINHSNRTTHERLLDRLGLPRERSVFNYDRLGHMGASDPFIALRGLLAEKRLRQGDLVLLLSSGFGFSWGVTAVEYRGA
ncbi:3-oxoacyl-ACP synthase III family protein [Allosalinactinospora lopnorensis]|uniref:3-oxoacyl-ACP synthase III family protein n=1 Tax=Allosalinactinospora lopnorensis TaxID=1352348 RepID=UPI001F41F4E0|nr:3-oxoacyl-[acyl-carrier-protein] synthase III C-terminal domain-containing protein [Allosalinactinospora lopnorensis]